MKKEGSLFCFVLLGFPGAEESLELKDGVIGGEDDEEDGKVSELEIG
jgi:hypothetical protein